jgi:hypothetical protein
MRKFLVALVIPTLFPVLFAQQSNSASPAMSNQLTSAPQPHTLMDGTPVKLRLSQTISSADAKVGQEIPFEVVEDVKVDEVIVLPKGATAIGTVTEAKREKEYGGAPEN